MTKVLCWLAFVLAALAYFTCRSVAADPWQDVLARADESVAVGNYEGAIGLAIEALGLVQSAPTGCDTCAARIYNNLGRYYFATELSAAESCYVKALDLRERSLGPTSTDVALSQSNLGRVYVQEGRYRDAQALFKKALAIQKRNYGPVHRDVARTSNSLGNLCRVLCDYHESERYYQDALVACRGWAGADSVAAMVYNGLGVLYQEEGRRPEAEREYQQALELYDSASCREPLRLATVVDNLARLWHEAGRYSEAERLYAQALGIFETYAGSRSTDAARILNNIAFLWTEEGDNDRADQALRQAISIQEAVLGPKHPAMAASLNNLAYVQIARGNLPAAEALMQRAVAINEAIGPAQEKSLAENMQGMSEIRIGKRDYAGTCRFARRAYELRLSSFRRAMTTFIERAAILNSLRMKSAAAFYISVLLDSPRGAEVNREAIASTVLNTKGIITDAMAARTWGIMNSVHISSCKDSLDEVSRKIQGLQQGTASDNSLALERLHMQRDRLEAEIARRQSLISERHNFDDISTAQICDAVPESGVLVEYMKYRHRTGLTTTEPRYLATVLAADRTVKVVSLGPAEPIDALVARYRTYFASPETRDAAEYESLSDSIYNLVWQPIAPWVQGKTMVVLAPDGELNLISFAGLRDATGMYLIERYSIHYCGSGRDLLRQSDDSESGYGLLAMGDPAFGSSTSGSEMPTRASRGGRLLSLLRSAISGGRSGPKIESLPRLPGTRREVVSICSLWRASSLEPVTECYGSDASEYAFRHCSSGKRIVYIATHGFSLTDSIAPQPEIRLWSGDDQTYVGGNPLALSGLALAPGNGQKGKTRAEANSSESDGLLSAEDIASLDLMSADLVVLSACETGLGTLISGEGAYGLRRATLIAGARTVISTLWSVDDRSTSALMSQFFARRGGNIPEMLRAVQIEQLQKARASGAFDDPFTWAPFVVTGAWEWR